MKTRSILLAALAVFAASLFTASAQKAGLYVLDGMDGGIGTNCFIAAGTTNLYAANGPGNIVSDPLMTEPIGSPVLRLDEYTNCALTLSLSTTNPAATGTVTFRMSKSFDGGNVWEDNPSVAITVTLNGTNTVKALALVYVPSETDLELTAGENPTAFGVTGLRMTFNLKSPKIGARSSLQ